MIVLTRLDGKEIVVNADLILTVEATPDTVIQLIPGGHLMVREPPEEIIERAAAWRRRCSAGPSRVGSGAVIAFQRPSGAEE